MLISANSLLLTGELDILSTLLLACLANLDCSSHIHPALYFPAESPVIYRTREESGKFYPGPDTSHHAAATSSGHFKSIQLSDPESENLNGSHASRCLLQLSAILGTVCVSASAFSFGPLFIYNSSRQSPLYIIAC